MDIEFKPVQTTPFSLRYKIKSRLWAAINGTLFRWTPWFMRRTRVAMLKAFGANIEWDCSISGGAEIVDPWNLTMGHLSSIDKDCCIRCRAQITMGNRACISRGVFLMTGSHDIESPHFNLVTKPIVIGDGVWVATGAKILPGVTLSNMSVVGAGAVVVKSTEANDVVGGNPARFIKKRIIKDE